MASQTPADTSEQPGTKAGAQSYLEGWAALTSLMHAGSSWSGRERNCSFFNLGDGQFAEGGFVSGLDFEDDGRAVAAVDWDADGALDLWLRNRTGPQLRFMHNEGKKLRPSVSLKLVGRDCNRDAVGARVELRSGKAVRRRSRSSGDGYLAQSSAWLHFALGASETIDRVTVHWPGGAAEEIRGVSASGRFSIVQGNGKATAVAPRGAERRWPRGGSLEARSGRMTRVLLKQPLQLPPTLSRELRDDAATPRAKLVNLWAHWCEPCLEELAGFAARSAEIEAAGLEVVAIGVDSPEDAPRAAELFASRFASREGAAQIVRQIPASQPLMDAVDALLKHLLGRDGERVLPTSLLVDRAGRLQLIYFGPLDVDGLLQDEKRFVSSQPQASRRSLFDGRWYFRTRRDLVGLADELRARGLREDAAFFYALDRAARTAPGR